MSIVVYIYATLLPEFKDNGQKTIFWTLSKYLQKLWKSMFGSNPCKNPCSVHIDENEFSIHVSLYEGKCHPIITIFYTLNFFHFLWKEKNEKICLLTCIFCWKFCVKDSRLPLFLLLFMSFYRIPFWKNASYSLVKIYK